MSVVFSIKTRLSEMITVLFVSTVVSNLDQDLWPYVLMVASMV